MAKINFCNMQFYPTRTLCYEFQIPRMNTLQNFITSQGQSKAVVCVSTPRMYPRSGYFLVVTKMNNLYNGIGYLIIYFYIGLN